MCVSRIGSYLVLGSLVLASQLAHAQSEIVVRLAEALGSQAAELILRSTPQGQALAMRVLGRPFAGDYDAHIFAERIHAEPGAAHVEEDLLQRFRTIEVDGRNAEGTMDIERVDAFAAAHFRMAERRFALGAGPISEIHFLEAESASNFQSVREAFLHAAVARETRLPSEAASMRIQSAFHRSWMIRYALLETVEGRAILRSLEPINPPRAGTGYRQPPVEFDRRPNPTRAFMRLVTPSQRGMAIELDHRLGLIMDSMSWVDPSIGEDALRGEVRRFVAKFLSLTPRTDGGFAIFTPITAPAPGPRNGVSNYYLQ